jgi:hypothetical protein
MYILFTREAKYLRFTGGDFWPYFRILFSTLVQNDDESDDENENFALSV